MSPLAGGGEPARGRIVFPEGARVFGLGVPPGSRGEVVPERVAESRKPKYADPTSWCYVRIHFRRVERFAAEVEREGLFKCFVHKTVSYLKSPSGVKRVEKPTISGVVFLQGGARALCAYLAKNHPGLRLAYDRGTELPAIIPDSQMQPFIRLSQLEPTRIRILEKPAGQYAKGNVRLRVLTGLFAGQEGYLVRINKDRRLVVDFGGMAVAISDVHKEQFEEARAAAERRGGK